MEQMSVFVDCIIMQKTASPDSRHHHQNESSTALEDWQLGSLANEGLAVKQQSAPFPTAVDLINNCPEIFEYSFEQMLNSLGLILGSTPVDKLETVNKPLAFVVLENSDAIFKMLKERNCSDNTLVLNLYTRIYDYRIKLFHLSDRVVRSSKMGTKRKQRRVRLLLHDNFLFLLEQINANFSLEQNAPTISNVKQSLLDQTKSTIDDSVRRHTKTSVATNPTLVGFLTSEHSHLTGASSKTQAPNSTHSPRDYNGSLSPEKPLMSVSNSQHSVPVNVLEPKQTNPAPIIGKLVFYSQSKNFGGLSTESDEIVFVSKRELLRAGINVDDSEFAKRLTKESIMIGCRMEVVADKGNQFFIGVDLQLVDRLDFYNQF
jgi:hypothetical protein